MNNPDIPILNGLVLAMDAHGTAISDGAVAITETGFPGVGRQDQFSDIRPKKVIDAAGGLCRGWSTRTPTHP
ncbi:MAG: hypothetical protein R2860_16895 [Desulfobacterales bacterium]